MKLKGIRKYSGYIMIGVVVFCAVLLFSYVQFSSTSTTTQESFAEQQNEKIMGTPNWKNSFSIGKNGQVIDNDTNKALPNVKAEFEKTQYGPSATIKFLDPKDDKKVLKQQVIHIFEEKKQLTETASGQAMPKADATYSKRGSRHTLTLKGNPKK